MKFISIKIKFLIPISALLLMGLSSAIAAEEINAKESKEEQQECDLTDNSCFFEIDKRYSIANFVPTKYIASAEMVEGFLNSEYSFDEQYILTTHPNSRGESQRIAVMHYESHQDDGQVLGIGSGGYRTKGDQLYIYAYWAMERSFDRPYGAMKITYQWSKEDERYVITEHLFFLSTLASNGWGANDDLLKDEAINDPDNREVIEKIENSAPDNAQILWGKAAHALIVETQTAIALEISSIRSMRERYCCHFMEDANTCLEELTLLFDINAAE